MDYSFQEEAQSLISRLQESFTNSKTKLNQKIQRNLQGYMASQIYLIPQENQTKKQQFAEAKNKARQIISQNKQGKLLVVLLDLLEQLTLESEQRFNSVKNAMIKEIEHPSQTHKYNVNLELKRFIYIICYHRLQMRLHKNRNNIEIQEVIEDLTKVNILKRKAQISYKTQKTVRLSPKFQKKVKSSVPQEVQIQEKPIPQTPQLSPIKMQNLDKFFQENQDEDPIFQDTPACDNLSNPFENPQLFEQHIQNKEETISQDNVSVENFFSVKFNHYNEIQQSMFEYTNRQEEHQLSQTRDDLFEDDSQDLFGGKIQMDLQTFTDQQQQFVGPDYSSKDYYMSEHFEYQAWSPMVQTQSLMDYEDEKQYNKNKFYEDQIVTEIAYED